MSEIGFTEEERTYVERLSLVSRTTYLAFYASVLVPLFAFGAYGIVKRDYVAQIVALVGLLVLLLVRIAQEIRGLPLCRSAFRKIVEHERRRASNV